MRQYQTGKKQMATKPKKASSPIWKHLFIGLLIMLVALFAVVLWRINTPRESRQALPPIDTTKDTKVGTFTTTKDQLNAAIANLLKTNQLDQVKVYVDEQQLILEGNIALVSEEYPVYLYLEPRQLSDGRMTLTVVDMSLGTLSVPKSEVLGLLKGNTKLPKWVMIDAKNAIITLDLPHLDDKQDFYVTANTIDLSKDTIVFDVYLKKHETATPS